MVPSKITETSMNFVNRMLGLTRPTLIMDALISAKEKPTYSYHQGNIYVKKTFDPNSTDPDGFVAYEVMACMMQTGENILFIRDISKQQEFQISEELFHSLFKEYHDGRS